MIHHVTIRPEVCDSLWYSTGTVGIVVHWIDTNPVHVSTRFL